jgi:hypothetical protein
VLASTSHVFDATACADAVALCYFYRVMQCRVIPHFSLVAPIGLTATLYTYEHLYMLYVCVCHVPPRCSVECPTVSVIMAQVVLVLILLAL